MVKPYGTYQTFDYQTVNLAPMKKFGLGLLKLVAVLFVLVALTVACVMLFNLVVIASNYALGWVAVHGWQVLLTGVIFKGAMLVKP